MLVLMLLSTAADVADDDGDDGDDAVKADASADVVAVTNGNAADVDDADADYE